MLSLVEKIRQMEKAGEKIIDMSVGQPEVPAPAHISEAMRNALLTPETSYATSAGSEELRKLIAQNLEKRSGIETNLGEVIVTSGSKHALFITLLSLIDPGDEVLVFEPYFPPYAEIVGFVGGILKTVPITSKQNEMKADVNSFLAAIGTKTKVVLLNYPNNPAGWTLDRSEVKRILDYCAEKGIFVVSDEIYDHIIFDGRAHCPAWTFSGQSDSAIHIGSFSKTYSMVPYRLGYVVSKKNVLDGVLKAQRATITMVSPYTQKAGIAALSGPQDFIKSRLDKYEERRNKCIAMLGKSNLVCARPAGAFYLFFPLPANVATDALEFASRLLEKYKIAVLPGGIFGEHWKNYIRISFATEDSRLYRGIESLVEFCKSS
jgi:aspartate aminotransferase